MEDDKYIFSLDSDISDEEKKMIRLAKEKQDKLLEEGRYDEVYDDDCPTTDPEQNPKLYAAFVKATEERNRRLAEMAKKLA